VSCLNLNETLVFCLVTVAFSMKGDSAQADSLRVIVIEPKELGLGAWMSFFFFFSFSFLGGRVKARRKG